MLFIVSAAGIAGAFALAIDGIMLGASGELERILAIVCFAMAAGALVGVIADDGRRPPARHLLTRADLVETIVTMIVAAPVVVVCVLVFLATLLPAIYVMLLVFIAWKLGSSGPRHVPAPPTRGPAQAPAYA